MAQNFWKVLHIISDFKIHPSVFSAFIWEGATISSTTFKIKCKTGVKKWNLGNWVERCPIKLEIIEGGTHRTINVRQSGQLICESCDIKISLSVLQMTHIIWTISGCLVRWAIVWWVCLQLLKQTKLFVTFELDLKKYEFAFFVDYRILNSLN